PPACRDGTGVFFNPNRPRTPYRECMRPRAFLTLAVIAAAFAHPMGNFSVNHYTHLQPSRAGVEIHYALDLAEIPTFELLRSWRIDRNAPAAAIDAKARAEAL